MTAAALHARDAPAARQAGLVGPNAIIQTHAALLEGEGPALTARIFASAGLTPYLHDLPNRMVPAAEITALSRALTATLGAHRAGAILAEAGARTADYLLAHRIPRAAQAALRLLPPPLAAWLLGRLIAAHAWTFAGPAGMSVRAGCFTLADNPFCPAGREGGAGCAFTHATFQRLYRALVSRRALVRPTTCRGDGGACCRFTVLR